MTRTDLMLAGALALYGSAAFADAFTDRLIEAYRAEGFTYIETVEGPSQVKLEATRDGRTVEVIYDRTTGEVLKSETERADAETAGRTGVESRVGDRDFLDDRDDRDDDGRDDRRGDDDDDDDGRDDDRDDDDGRDDDRRGGDDDDDDDRDNSGRGGHDDDDDDRNGDDDDRDDDRDDDDDDDDDRRDRDRRDRDDDDERDD